MKIGDYKKRGYTKEERAWTEFSEEEANSAIGDFSLNFLVNWMEKYGIRYGSGGDYNLYTAVQNALLGEWLKGNPNDTQ